MNLLSIVVLLAIAAALGVRDITPDARTGRQLADAARAAGWRGAGHTLARALALILLVLIQACRLAMGLVGFALLAVAQQLTHVGLERAA